MYQRTESGHNKEFFNTVDAKNYFSNFINKMKLEVEKMSDSDITLCNFQEFSHYLVNKYFIAPIYIYETNIEKMLFETKIKKGNPLRGLLPYERDFFEIDGVRITFKIPFDGEPALFEVKPGSCILSHFFTRSFVKPYEDDCGSFTLDLEYTKQELQEKGEKMQEYVQNQFANEFRSYKKMIDNINIEVNQYNNNLNTMALQLLDARKKKADSLSAISFALQIPLTTSKNAPNTNPIQLKRIIRKPAIKPNIISSTPESCISDYDYKNINNIISMCGITMEKNRKNIFC